MAAAGGSPYSQAPQNASTTVTTGASPLVDDKELMRILQQYSQRQEQQVSGGPALPQQGQGQVPAASGFEQQQQQVCAALHPGGNLGANFESISHTCHPILVAFLWELTS